MKIAITSDLYYPMINGVAVFTHNLAKGMAARGHEVMVICPSFEGRSHREVEDGVTVVYVKSVRFPLYPDQLSAPEKHKEILGKQLPKLVYKHGIWVAPYPKREIFKALKKFQPDVIHNQTAETIALGALKYAHKTGTPIVSTGHAYPDNITGQKKMPRFVKKSLDAVLRSYMSSFLKNSEYATMPTEMAIGDLIPENRRRFKVPVEAVSNGIDLDNFSAAKPKVLTLKNYGLPKGRPIVLYVGRVDPEKSISDVVRAFKGVVKKVPQALMVVVGDGTDLANLQELVKKLEIENDVMFLGKVTGPDLVELYRAGTLFATASRTETQGIVLIEAAATGQPLVAVDAGAVKELCQNKRNGFLCTPGDIDEMTKGMVKILKDEKLRARFSAESLRIAKHHDLNRTLKRFEEIYEEAILLKRKSQK